MTDPIFVRRGLRNHPSSLVLLVPWKYKWPTGLLVCFISGSLYLSSNHLLLFKARQLSIGSIDKNVPFIPETVWIYVSLFLLIPYVYYLNRCVVSLNKHIYSFFFTICFSVLLFWFFPTSYPRELFPIPESTDPWTSHLISLIRTVDGPTNCAPSLHVSISYQIAFGFLEDRKEYFPFVLLWATFLSFSTLTTKQHYFFDVTTGFALALLVHLFFHHFLRYRFR